MVLLVSSVHPPTEEAAACVSFLMGETGGGEDWALLSKALIQLAADRWGCTPFLLVVWPWALWSS